MSVPIIIIGEMPRNHRDIDRAQHPRVLVAVPALNHRQRRRRWQRPSGRNRSRDGPGDEASIEAARAVKCPYVPAGSL